MSASRFKTTRRLHRSQSENQNPLTLNAPTSPTPICKRPLPTRASTHVPNPVKGENREPQTEIVR